MKKIGKILSILSGALLLLLSAYLLVNYAIVALEKIKELVETIEGVTSSTSHAGSSYYTERLTNEIILTIIPVIATIIGLVLSLIFGIRSIKSYKKPMRISSTIIGTCLFVFYVGFATDFSLVVNIIYWVLIALYFTGGLLQSLLKK